MTDKVKISAKERKTIGKTVKQLRAEGETPAVIYGKERKPLAISFDAHDFAMMYRTAGGNTIVQVEIEKEDGNERKNALIHTVDRDAVTGQILHADLLQIKMNEKITASVPLHFVGDSTAVIDLGGSLLTTKNEVNIECLPGDLLHGIEIDIAPLADFETVLHVSDIVVPEGVEIKDDPEETIAYVEAPRSEEEMEELEAPVEENIPAEEGAEEATEETTEETPAE